jgi:ketosteroid isomerase-like protein
MGPARVGAAWRPLAAFNSGELDRLWPLLHPDCVIQTDPSCRGGGTFEGVAEIRRLLDRCRAFGAARFVPEDVPVELGDRVLFRGRWARSRASTVLEAESSPFTVVVSVRDDAISGVHLFASDRAARRFAKEGR